MLEPSTVDLNDNWRDLRAIELYDLCATLRVHEFPIDANDGTEGLYSGEMRSGKRHGQGMMVFSSGSRAGNTYEGSWVNDKMDGFGTYIWHHWKGRSVYEGFFENNCKHGQGKLSSWNGVHRGSWRCDRKHGMGVLVSNNVEIKGWWLNDKLIKGVG